MYLVFDFDSTIIKTEGLEELAEIALSNNTERQEILNKIVEITKKGMRGDITYRESLSERLKLIEASVEHIESLNGNLVNKISDSVASNLKFFEDNAENIYIISGGFLDFIHPVTDHLSIPREHVFGNKFEYDNRNNIIGFVESNPLSHSGGKPEVIRNLLIEPQKVTVVGDGYTDYEIKEKGLASNFYLYTENVYRENLLPMADQVVKDVNHLISLL